ncbi:hypothetical protein DFH11DRAFT_1541990 [Phellopilus nigrolimitatus]|nr:hypothetical protein DFH11DRAFT_1541990 [Phellopilus nigrolimitatus]
MATANNNNNNNNNNSSSGRRDDKHPSDDDKLAAVGADDLGQLLVANARVFLRLLLCLLRLASRGAAAALDLNVEGAADLNALFAAIGLGGGQGAASGAMGGGALAPNAAAAASTNTGAVATADAGAPAVASQPAIAAIKTEAASSSSCSPGPSSAGVFSTQRRMRWYVITAGLRTGVFTDWLEAGRYVSGVTGAIFRGYDTEEEAVECYAEALRLGRVRVVPDINNILGRRI